MRRLIPLLLAGIAQADNPRFDVSVAPSENVTLDQTVELNITLDRDGTQPFESYRAPLMPDFDVLHSGTSEQVNMTWVNGRQTVRILEQHQYLLRPKKKGALAISPASVKVAGAELHTRAITIHVAPPSKNAISLAPGPQAPSLPPPPESMRGSEELFVDARADKSKIYVGEQVTATWRLYTQTDILKYRPIAEPKYEDFWSEDLLGGQRHLAHDLQVVNGAQYDVAVLMKKALFPLKAGKLTITPLDVEVTTMNSMFNPNASAERRSPVLNVEVKPLPADGRPRGFEPANVGQFELAAVVDRAQVKAGEAVTWRVTLRGTGNVRNVKLPKLDSVDGFKVYDPTVKEQLAPQDDVVRGEKTYTWLLMPERGGSLTLPSLELAYFDPAAGKYAVAKAPTIAITVEGDPSKVTAAPATAPQENVLESQIRPIRNRSKVHSSVGERLLRGRLAAVMLAAPPGAWLLVLVGDALRRRLARETAGSKRRRARRSARRRLRVAEYHIKAQRPSAFFGECARVIYEHLEYRLGAKVEALTLGELRAHLVKHGFDKETAEAVVKELENCDFARFAPSASGPGEMRAALRRVRTLLGWIEKTRPVTEKEAA
jgi:BatD DUF11 like domain